jgi:DNA-binding NarL/FixJ family response regulator
MTKIGIADDHKMLLDGLQLLLTQEADFQLVFLVDNGKKVLEQLQKQVIDVLVLDINLPVLNGIKTCKLVHENYPIIKIIALTTYDKGAFIQQMLKAGASGYVLKEAASDELVTAIRTVVKGDTYFSPKVSQTLMNHLRNERTQNDHFIPQLTRREKQVLQLIAAEQTTKEIALQLHLSENTIETHRRNLLTKLNVRNVAGLMKVALQKGLIE